VATIVYQGPMGALLLSSAK